MRLTLTRESDAATARQPRRHDAFEIKHLPVPPGAPPNWHAGCSKSSASRKDHAMRSPAHLIALALLTLNFILVSLPLTACAQPYGSITVNGVALDGARIVVLENAYRTRLVPGRYWYDSRSGLWGHEMGPSQGQIAAGLNFGGVLNPRASVGHRAGVTGVFVNGRELHPQELVYLQRLYGQVQQGRYWLDAQGIGGYEGRPAQFDLRARAIAQQRSTGYTRRGPGGNTGSDGQCAYYNDPSSGASVMTGNC
jgi:hypothetical protein